MKLLILFAFLLHSSFALELSIESAKDEFQKYSTLSINEKHPFTCQEIVGSLGVVKEVICAFSRKPKEHIGTLEDDFFEVKSFFKKDVFFISIKPKHKLKLFANIFDLAHDAEVFNAEVSLCKSWLLVGYKEKLPLIKEEEPSRLALDFPFYQDEDMMPYVGSLDIKGNPVFIKKVEDVNEYLRVKRYFEDKNYEQCLEITNEVLQKYPNTLFKAELMYYKIKIYAKLKDYDNVIATAKEYIREYSADENIAEVLSLLAYSYAKIGMTSDADYFFDRLFSEHAQSKYAKLGYIYRGMISEEAGGVKKAESYYKKALYSTKDIDVAVKAAYRLAQLKLSLSKAKEAGKYARKILKAKPRYFVEHMQDSIKFIKELAQSGEYGVAAGIDSAMLKEIDPSYDEYEELLAYKGLWLAHTDKKREAFNALSEYEKKFPDGDYIDKITLAKDELFFDLEDTNTTQTLKELNTLLEDYSGTSIGERALYEKAKVLLKLHRYDAVLAMKEKLLELDTERFGDIDAIIHEAAVGSMKEALKQNRCEEVLLISSEHNVTLSSKWDDSVYKCAMMGGDYQLAKRIAVKYLDTDNADEKEKWLYRYIKINFSTGNYEDVLKAAKDLITLIEMDNKSKYDDIYRILFDTYSRLENQDGMIETMVSIEKRFGDSYKDIDRYAQMVAVGIQRKDDNMVIHYGRKIYDIQRRNGSHVQSPYVEFSLYQAYMNKEDYKNALEVIRSLDGVELKKEQRARQKYLLGAVLEKLWRDDEAKKAYEEAIEADPESAWAKLAKSAINL